MVSQGCPDRARSPGFPVLRKRSWTRRMTEWRTPSCLETSRPRIPSPAHPRARPGTSVLSLRVGGVLTQALATAL